MTISKQVFRIIYMDSVSPVPHEYTTDKLFDAKKRLEVKDNAPITYENMINLTFVEYFFADLFNLQLPKYKDCQHEDTCRSYYLEQKKDEIQD